MKNLLFAIVKLFFYQNFSVNIAPSVLVICSKVFFWCSVMVLRKRRSRESLLSNHTSLLFWKSSQKIFLPQMGVFCLIMQKMKWHLCNGDVHEDGESMMLLTFNLFVVFFFSVLFYVNFNCYFFFNINWYPQFQYKSSSLADF